MPYNFNPFTGTFDYYQNYANVDGGALVAAPWLPSDVAGCIVCLQSDLGITKDGSNYVSNWNDQSGLGNNVSQATGDNQPLWVDAQLNGEAILRFDGTNDCLSGVPITEISGDMDVFIVCKQVSWGSVKGYLSMGAGAASLDYNNGFVLEMQDAQDRVRIAAGVVGTGALSWTLWEIQSVPSTPREFLLKNGSAVGNEAFTKATIDRLIVGARWLSGIGYQGNMEVAFVGVYNNIISSANRTLLQTWVTTKYGIAMA